MNERIHVVADFTVKSDAIDDFTALARRLLVQPTRTEPGCITYELCQDIADPTRFTMVEAWDSDAALERHLAQPALARALEELRPHVASAPVVRRLRPV